MKFRASLLVIFCSFMVFSQKEPVSDSLVVNKKKIESDSVKKHSVLKAALFSAILPGAGQVYNHLAMPKGKKKAFWKVPLIYAGLGVTGYFAFKNNVNQKSLKTEYKFREASGFTQINNPEWAEYDENSLIELYQQYSNRRNWLIIGCGLVYLIQVADAAIEAHFVSFDISENLSLQVRPTLLQNPFMTTNNVGVSIALKFRK